MSENYVSSGTDTWNGSGRLTFKDNPTSSEEAQAGFQNLSSVANAINKFLAAKTQAGTLDATWLLTGSLDGGSLRMKMEMFAPAGSTHTYTYYLSGSDELIATVLGFEEGRVNRWKDENDQPVWAIRAESLNSTDGSNPASAAIFASASPPRSYVPRQERGASPIESRFRVDYLRGNWFNNRKWAPSPLLEQFKDIENWGFVRIGDAIYPVEYIDGTEFRVLVPKWGTSGGIMDVLSKNRIRSKGNDLDDAGDPTVEQVVILQASLDRFLTHCLGSTAGAAYNSEDLDDLAEDLAAGIPYELIQTEFVKSVRNVQYATSSAGVTVVLTKPTPLQEVIMPELVIRQAGFVLEDNELQLAGLSNHFAGLQEHTLSESNKAAPADTEDPQRTLVFWSTEWQVSTIKLEYNFDLEGKAQNTILIRNQDAIESGVNRTVTVSMRNTVSGVEAGSDVVRQLATDLVQQVLPMFGRPVAVFERTIAHTLYHAVPGDGVQVTDTLVRDPDTGVRGLTAVPGIVLETRHSWGGNGEANTGFMRGILFERDRVAQYSPAARVDDTASNGGYDSGTDTLTILANEYTSSATSGGDGGYFADGDEVTITEKDPEDPFNPLQWSRTVDSGGTSTTIPLTAAISSPAWDSSKKYVVTSDKYTDATSDQKTKCYLASADDELIQDVAQPYEYGLARSGKRYDLASPADVLPERHAAWFVEDGAPRNPAVDGALARMANNLVEFKTAPMAPILFEEDAVRFQGTAEEWVLAAVIPLFVGRGRLGAGRADVYRPINVAPIFKAASSYTGKVRVTSAPGLPARNPGSDYAGPDNYYTWCDVEHVGETSSVTFSTTSTSFTKPSSLQLPARPNPDGVTFLTVEIADNVGNGDSLLTTWRGLADLSVGEFTDPFPAAESESDLILRDVISLTTTATTLTFGPSGDGSQLYALDGLSDYDIIITGDLRIVQNSPEITFRPNGLSTNQYSWGNSVDASTSTPNLSHASKLHCLGGGMTQPLDGHIYIRFSAEDGTNRAFYCEAGAWEQTATGRGDQRLRKTHGYWEGSGTALTSLEIVSSVANAFGSGTKLKLYTLKSDFS